MLFLAQMNVRIPHDADKDTIDQLKAAEKKRSAELQRSGTWVHLWRIAGRHANVSVFDVSSHDELHDILWTLPLFPYLDIEITPLATHPSAI